MVAASAAKEKPVEKSVDLGVREFVVAAAGFKLNVARSVGLAVSAKVVEFSASAGASA